MTHPIPDDLRRALDAATHAAAGIASTWVDRLNDADRRRLTGAFHRAESLAFHALTQAIGQIGEAYREALGEQIADEVRHIDVFARWEAPEAVVPAPAEKRRTEPVWFALLLVNEVAGFCQFQMLAALAGDPERRGAVLDIASDETRHIARLVGWLAPWYRTPSVKLVDRIFATFRRNLPGRMTQFIARSELNGLRDAMVDVVDRTLGEVDAVGRRAGGVP